MCLDTCLTSPWILYVLELVQKSFMDQPIDYANDWYQPFIYIVNEL